MWLVIVGVLSLGVSILALIGLLVLARESFRERSRDAGSTGAPGAMDRHDRARAHGRRRVMTP